MARRYNFNTEEIIAKLREAKVLLAQEVTVAHASRQRGVSEHTYYRWLA